MPVLGLVVGRGADNGLRPKARRCHASPCAGRRELTEPTEATPAAVVTAVRDACVLFSATLRDTLLRAAAIRLCEPYLTDTILEEVSRNVVRRGRMSEERAAHLVEAMRSAFPQALVTGFEHLVDQMTNDPKDRQVLAAAARRARSGNLTPRG